ncbi:MAG: Gx transporter family protein [Chitinispirillales bacterium]|jgi:heptaprenyl diphosphate synthase|nr:Gx transporter family protein [Chitinispirillales bacterium]
MISTPSLIKQDNGAALQKAVWLLAAVALNAVELAIPRVPFLPWLKPGFANIITILWIIRFGFTDAILYTALRVWISGFYFGFSLFTLSLSFSGGLLSTVVMSALWVTLGKRKLIGTAGIAMTGALFHNAGQFFVVYFIMSQNISLLGQIPFMLGASIVFGGIVGILVPVAARIIGFYGNAGNSIASVNITVNQTAEFIDKIIVVLTFAASISLMFVNNFFVLTIAAILFSLTAVMINPKKPAVFFYPVKFYMLFIFIAATYLFFSYGARLDLLPFLTRDGLFSFVKQSLRLWCWLQTVHIFKKFKFHELFMGALQKFFPGKKETLAAGMIALKHFPEITRLAKSKTKIPITALLLKPKMVLTEYMNSINSRIALIVDNEHVEKD